MSSSERSSASPPPSVVKKEKKRKRSEPAADELEIDVNLPEPLSKKDLRRAKKGKTGPAPQASLKDQSDLQDVPATEAAPSAATDKPAAESKRSEYGIWIGNLAFHITPSALKEFLVAHGSLDPEQITRVNLPVTNRPLAPFQTRLMRTQGKTDIPQFQNKGFAYVDFSTADALFQALQVTETEFDGRKVLIKDAKNFAGRPVVAPAAASESAPPADGKPRSKRIFVGNLAFDVTRQDIETHFAQAGEVEDVFLASFEDTGKCKGYGWVRFTNEDDAEKAVKGWIWKEEDGDEGSGDDEKKVKKRKWWINKIYGRQLRCEFAEDAQTRYKKRYGKGGQKSDGAPAAAIEEVDGAAKPEGGFKEGGFKKRFGRGTEEQRTEQRRQKHRDARKTASGQALASAPRASAAIVEAKGTKVTFDE